MLYERWLFRQPLCTRQELEEFHKKQEQQTVKTIIKPKKAKR